MFSTNWDGWGHGTFDIRFPFGRGRINRHSRVVCSISELSAPAHGPLDYPFLGGANIQILNIAPTDNGEVFVRINVSWDSTLQWRVTFFIDG
jgi:hypothetical protein